MLAALFLSSANCLSVPLMMALHGPLGNLAALIATKPLHGACLLCMHLEHVPGLGPLPPLWSSSQILGEFVMKPEGFLIGAPFNLPLKTLAPNWHWSPDTFLPGGRRSFLTQPRFQDLAPSTVCSRGGITRPCLMALFNLSLVGGGL